MVEVPLPAGRLIAVHQQAGEAAHVAVEELHAELLPALRPGREGGGGGEETVIAQDLRAPALHHLHHAPFAGFGDEDARWRMPCDGAPHFAGEGAGVGGIVEAHVIDGEAVTAEGFLEMAHGGEDEHQLLLVVLHVSGFFHHLHHQHGVAGLTVTQRGDATGELIAQHDAERGHLLFCLSAARQRSEQVFTLSQSRSHFLRQANGLPQHAQSFDGSSDFLRMRGT